MIREAFKYCMTVKNLISRQFLSLVMESMPKARKYVCSMTKLGYCDTRNMSVLVVTKKNLM